MLRTLAEMENLRKRTMREVSDARTYAISGFARDVLDIADNLQRALDAVPAEARAAADPGLEALIEGVELTERSLHNSLEKHGVRNSIRPAKSSIPTSIRRCTKFPIRPSPSARSRRSFRPAT